MSASNADLFSPRVAVRLRVAEHPSGDRLDGGWWPQSRDLFVELADLVDHFPAEHGRVVRVLYSPRDWEAEPSNPQTSVGAPEVMARRGSQHLVRLETSTGKVMEVLVVPSGMSAGQGEEALLAAATPGNTETARSLLDTVTEFPDVDPADPLADHGGTWWFADTTAPSFRTEP